MRSSAMPSQKASVTSAGAETREKCRARPIYFLHRTRCQEANRSDDWSAVELTSCAFCKSCLDQQSSTLPIIDTLTRLQLGTVQTCPYCHINVQIQYLASDSSKQDPCYSRLLLPYGSCSCTHLTLILNSPNANTHELLVLFHEFPLRQYCYWLYFARKHYCFAHRGAKNCDESVCLSPEL